MKLRLVHTHMSIKKLKAGTWVEITGIMFKKYCESGVMLKPKGKNMPWLDAHWFKIERIDA